MIEILSEFLCPAQGVICWRAQKMIRKTIGTPSACGGGGAGDDLHKLKQANCCRFRPHSQRLNCLSSTLWIKHLYCTESMKQNITSSITKPCSWITHLTHLFDSYGKNACWWGTVKTTSTKRVSRVPRFYAFDFLRFISHLRRTCRDCVAGAIHVPGLGNETGNTRGFQMPYASVRICWRERERRRSFQIKLI